MNKLIAAFLLIIFISQKNYAQMYNPVTWSYAAKKTGKYEGEIFIRAKIEHGWHIYGEYMHGETPIPTSIRFDQSGDFSKIGNIEENPKAKRRFEEAFSKNIFYFENEVTFKQKIKFKSSSPVVTGNIVFMACSNTQCLPPGRINFTIPIK